MKSRDYMHLLSLSNLTICLFGKVSAISLSLKYTDKFWTAGLTFPARQSSILSQALLSVTGGLKNFQFIHMVDSDSVWQL